MLRHGARDKCCVVHLVRYANGPIPAQRFLDSYTSHQAGASHDLVVVLKGFPSEHATRPYRDMFAEVASGALAVADRGFDISAYRAAAVAVHHENVVFLNSFSVILHDNWLELMRRHHCNGVGAVGATGSYESHLTALERQVGSRPSVRPSRFANQLAAVVRLRQMRRLYPRFPNPHIRTNAFLTRRQLFLALDFGSTGTKDGVQRFESGKRGMTRQLEEMGLSVVVAGSNGRGYMPSDWPTSRTFRCGNQENLLVSDNRTAEYRESGPLERAHLAALAWGANR